MCKKLLITSHPVLNVTRCFKFGLQLHSGCSVLHLIRLLFLFLSVRQMCVWGGGNHKPNVTGRVLYFSFVFFSVFFMYLMSRCCCCGGIIFQDVYFIHNQRLISQLLVSTTRSPARKVNIYCRKKKNSSACAMIEILECLVKIAERF